MVGPCVQHALPWAPATLEFRNEVALIWIDGRSSELPLLAQATPGHELQVMCARNVIAPRLQHELECTRVRAFRQWCGPTVVQRLRDRRSLNEIVERLNLPPALQAQTLLQTGMRQGGNADQEPSFGMPGRRNVLRMQNDLPQPSRVIMPTRGGGIHNTLHRHTVASAPGHGHLPQITRTIKHDGFNRMRPCKTWISSTHASQQRQRLDSVGQVLPLTH